MRHLLSLARWMTAGLALAAVPLVLLFGLHPDDALLRSLAATSGDLPAAIRRIGGVALFDADGQVVEVDLSSQRWTRGALVRLTSLSQLRSLTLGTGTLTADEVQLLQKFPHLKALGLNFTRIDNGAFADIAALSQLESVRLYMTPVAPGDIHQLARLNRLRVLELRSCVSSISDLSDTFAAMQNLEELSLRHSLPDDATFASIGALPRLKRLDLCSTMADDNQVKALAELPELRELLLDNNPLSDKGVREVTRLPRLESLSLTRCANITGDALKTLSAMPSLKHLLVRHTPITPVDAAEFAQTRPDCRLTRSRSGLRF